MRAQGSSNFVHHLPDHRPCRRISARGSSGRAGRAQCVETPCSAPHTKGHHSGHLQLSTHNSGHSSASHHAVHSTRRDTRVTTAQGCSNFVALAPPSAVLRLVSPRPLVPFLRVPTVSSVTYAYLAWQERFSSQDCSSSSTLGFPWSAGRLFGNSLWCDRRFSTYSFVLYLFYLSISFPPLCLIPFLVVFPLSSVFLCAYGSMLCQWSCARLHRSHRCDPGSLPICWTKAK